MRSQSYEFLSENANKSSRKKAAEADNVLCGKSAGV